MNIMTDYNEPKSVWMLEFDPEPGALDREELAIWVFPSEIDATACFMHFAEKCLSDSNLPYDDAFAQYPGTTCLFDVPASKFDLAGCSIQPNSLWGSEWMQYVRPDGCLHFNLPLTDEDKARADEVLARHAC
jgi:hypothetical protein